MNSTDIFNQLKSMSPNGKIRQEQVDVLYEILNKGVEIELVMKLLGGSTTTVELQKPAPSEQHDGKYKLSQRSLDRLIGVNPNLVKVVKRAIQISEIDFMVVEGLRTKETQAEYVKKGVSKTMNSYHLTGHAVDLAPIVNGKIPIIGVYAKRHAFSPGAGIMTFEVRMKAIRNHQPKTAYDL